MDTNSLGYKAGQEIGSKVGAMAVYYTLLKQLDRPKLQTSAQADAMARELCTRVESGKKETVGPWMKETYGLDGTPAGQAAVAAMLFQCPKTYEQVK